ncbi:MAG: DUF6414 family protein [Chloroflexota bacterium]
MADQGQKVYVPESGVDIVHPIYLDIPMMTSFVAALEGGFAYVDKRRTSSTKLEGTQKSASGRLGVPILSSLFRMDMSGDIKSTDDTRSIEEVEVERQHTASSLFNLLRWKLVSDLDLVKFPTSAEDLRELEPGALVEIRGVIASDPVSDLFEALNDVIASIGQLAKVSAIGSLMDQGLDRLIQELRGQPNMAPLLIAFGADNSAPQMSGKPRGGNQAKHSSSNPPQQSKAVLAPVLLAQMGTLVERFRAETDSRSVIDFLLHSPDDALRAVLTVSRKHLPTEGSPLMLGGEYAVLGKVTSVLEGPDNEIQLLRRSIFRYLTPRATRAAHDYMTQNRFLNLNIPELIVRGPALQLLPVAIYS